MRKKWQFSLFMLILAGLLVSACTSEPLQQTSVGTPTATLDGTLRPFPSDTPTITPLPTNYVSPTLSPTITPTPTNVYFEVGEEDDMGGIAYLYGISAADIMTANPDVNPRAMSVGTMLLIPITPSPPPAATPTSDQAQATPTPTEEPEVPPDCYQDALGGMWCFALYENDTDSPLENVSGMISLGEAEDARQETAITPLNLLPAGTAQPLIAYFAPPLPAQWTASFEVDFSLPVMTGDDRYLDLDIEEQTLSLSEDGLTATVTGTVSLSAVQPDADYVWISATAFDAEGHVVAVRRWDNAQGMASGGLLDFRIMLYSMGAPIDHVDLATEAQPVLAEETP